MLPPQSSAAPAHGPTPRRLLGATLSCLLCARPVGTITAGCWPPSGPVLFQPDGAPAAGPLARWWRLRCPLCGGNAVVGELVDRTVRAEPPIDWQAERPRRGRPPKRLAIKG